MSTKLENPRVVIRIPGLTPRQREMLEHKARILHIGCGTKTGKSFALGSWVSQGIVAGERCCWVGPWYPRVRAAFETIKSILGPLIDSSEMQVTETMLRIRGASGGGLDCFSGDNYQGVYGGNFSRVVVDEASRCPSAIWPAVLTTISATNGKARAAFNLELGSKNWAIRNLLRVQAMDLEQRKAAGEDFLTFPTGGDGLVEVALIEALRSQMPEPLWRALYLAEIPESDVALFRNLDEIFSGVEFDKPAEGASYVAGIDLGRKQDWTVVTVIDSRTGAVVASDRYHQISWTLQCERAAALYKQFHCSKAWVDATGVGDPVTEELEKLGLYVRAFIFSTPSRKALLENLILACDNCEITIPATDKFSLYRHELESFEYQLDGNTVRYAAPPNMHDDCVMSLALAVHGFKQGGFGFLELWRQEAEAIRAGQQVVNTSDEQAKLQAEAQVRHVTAGVFGEQLNRVVPIRTVQQVSKSETTVCPSCSNPNITRCAVQGLSGDVEEKCGRCGWSDVIPGRVLKVRA